MSPRPVMTSPFGLATFGAGVVAVAVVIGCSSGEDRVVDSPLYRYFHSVLEIRLAGADCLIAIEDALDEDIPDPDTRSDETRLNDLRAVTAGFVSCSQTQTDEIRGLDPPPEVQDAHEDFVRTDAEDLAFQRTRNELAASAESAADFVELSARHDEENRGDLIDRLVDSCLALQQIADENDIDEDLMCGE